MIEEAQKFLSGVVGHEVVVEDGTLVIPLTAQDDWEDVYTILTAYGSVEDWNGAFVPGIRGTIISGSEFKVFPVAVVYCGCCC